MPQKKRKKRQKSQVVSSSTNRKPFYIFCGILCFVLLVVGAVPWIVGHHLSSLNGKTIPGEQFRVLRNQLVTLVNKEDPKVALNRLKEMLGDDKIANECHSLAHFIGNAAYKKYNDVSKALSYNDELCGSGYMHGVIEEKFAHVAGQDDIYATLTSICAPDNLGICYHGVGHGFMWYSSDDLYASLASCDRLQEQYQTNNCYDGVFMENFEGDHADHPTTYINPQNPTYPCNQVDGRYKESCYFYSARYYLQLYPQKYTDAFSWCRTVETGYELTCIKGVGSAMMKQNRNEPNKIAALCDQTKTTDEKIYCLDGMVSYFLTDTFSLEKGQAMCQKLTGDDRQYCQDSLATRQSMFPN